MPEMLVLDASVGIRVALQSQPGHKEALACYERALRHGYEPVAPDLYLYEVGNVIARGRSEAGRLERLLEIQALADVRRPSPEALARALDIAGDGKLSFYDATYVALAEELASTLWTEDREILKRFPRQTADTTELLRKLK